MGAPVPLSLQDRQRIYEGWVNGQTIEQIAGELQRSAMTVRKWWRRIRPWGLAGLAAPRRGRPAAGGLATFAPTVKRRAVVLKRAHPRWGAARVLVELRADPELVGQALPSSRRLAALFKQDCPEAVAPRIRRSAPSQAPAPAQAVHEVWQIDHQEKVVLADGTVATVCKVRDPVGAAMLASYAVPTPPPKRWRQVSTFEVQEVLRQAFPAWHTFPDSILTDNE